MVHIIQLLLQKYIFIGCVHLERNNYIYQKQANIYYIHFIIIRQNKNLFFLFFFSEDKIHQIIIFQISHAAILLIYILHIHVVQYVVLYIV